MPSSTRYNPAAGQLDPNVNQIDPNLKSDRTREFVVGIEHELMPNVGISVDYIWRKYDRGNGNYIIGGVYPPSDVYVGPFNYTDPTSGQTGNLLGVCQTCLRQAGPTITPEHPELHLVQRRGDLGREAVLEPLAGCDLGDLSDAKEYQQELAATLTRPTATRRKAMTAATRTSGTSSSCWARWRCPGNQLLGNLNVQDGFIRTIVITGPTGRFGG